MIKLPPKTTEEVVARERERKARITLLVALPEDHLAKFRKMADAKEMWEATKSRFGGNDESKKMQKYLLKQQFNGFLCLSQWVCIKEDIDWSGHVEEDAQNYAMMAYSSSNSGSDNKDDPHGALKDKGIVGSGCSMNMIGNKAHLADYQEFKGGSIAFGGSNGRITDKGKIKAGRLDFEDVYYVEELKHYNLFSVSQMCDKKNKVLFTDTACLVLSLDFKLPDKNQVLLKIPRQHNMYSFNLKNIDPSRDLAYLFAKALIDEYNKWHRRLGHVNIKNLNKIVKGNLVRGLPSKIFENNHTCVACQKGKQHKASCKAKTVSYVNQPLQILHMDLFGPTSVRSINYKTYCLVITDGFSRFSWVYFLKSKDETTPILKGFIRQAENQFNHKVKTIRSDNGTEFKNNELIEFCGLKGIKREYINARTPQQNGVAERKNITLIKAARTMLADSFLPTMFWAEAVNTACKFDEKSDSGFLVGYSLNSKAFRVYNLETKRDEENLHVNFLENKPNVAGKGHAWMFDLDYLTNSMNYEHVLVDNQANKSVGPKEANNSAGTQANDDQGANSKEISLYEEHFVLPIWSAYSTTVKSLGDKIEKTTDAKPCEKPDAQTNSTNLLKTVSIPLSAAGPSRALNDGKPSYPDDPLMSHLEDIYASPSERIFTDSSYNDEGVVTDFNNLEITVNVWILVDLPFRKKAIETKWVYRNKKDESGVIVRNKARLVTQGHKQEKGIDYDESAFLYGTIDEEVYVTQPPEVLCDVFEELMKNRFQMSYIGELTFFLRLQLYQKEDGIFISQDKPDVMFVVCACSRFQVTPKTSHLQAMKIIFRRLISWQCKKQTIMATSTTKAEYVVVAHCCRQVLWIQNQLLDYGFNLMSIKIYIDNESIICIVKNPIFYSKTKHIEIRHHFIRDDYEKKLIQVLKIHTDDNVADLLTKPLVKDKEAVDVDVHLYWSMIASLMYLTASRPDVMFVVCACSRFQVTPKTSHLQAMKIIFRRLISWQCKKQTIMATSTTKAEYVVVAHCCRQVLWIQNQLLDYGFNLMSIKIYIDNESIICIVKNPIFYSKTKHIEIRHHFIRDDYEKKLIQVLKIHTDDNVADLLTK
nr:putative ribonuclease H-like domain-containing protein [Tanacetum cinerariifolium]